MNPVQANRFKERLDAHAAMSADTLYRIAGSARNTLADRVSALLNLTTRKITPRLVAMLDALGRSADRQLKANVASFAVCIRRKALDVMYLRLFFQGDNFLRTFTLEHFALKRSQLVRPLVRYLCKSLGGASILEEAAQNLGAIHGRALPRCFLRHLPRRVGAR